MPFAIPISAFRGGWPRDPSAGAAHRDDVPRQLHAGVESAQGNAGGRGARGAGIADRRGPRAAGRASGRRFGLIAAGVVSPDGAAILKSARPKSNRDSALCTQAHCARNGSGLPQERRATANRRRPVGGRSSSSRIGIAVTATPTNASTMCRVPIRPRGFRALQ